MTSLFVQKLHHSAIPLDQAYPGDAGFDLPVLMGEWVPSGAGVDIRTGWAIAIPDGHYGRIVGRSSTLRKKGLMVIEGIIDCGFRGELFAYVYNPGRRNIWVEEGTSLAQLIVSPIPTVDIRVLESLPNSERGDRGFGSSGR